MILIIHNTYTFPFKPSSLSPDCCRPPQQQHRHTIVYHRMAKKDVKKVIKPVVAKSNKESNSNTINVASNAAVSTISLFEELSKSVITSYKQYLKDLENDQKLRLIDTFLAFLVVVGIIQFSFCLLGGSFPFNAFLGGFSATIGQCVLTVGLRLQNSDSNKDLFNGLLPERAFGEYILASLILHFVIIHFIN